MSRQQAATDDQVTDFDWKGRVSDTLLELNIIPDTFTGEIMITFKNGGIGHLEKKEVLK